ncbi:MAG: CCA tRNA nucleotidyltransferase [Acutalibacteraceae bacterium]
MNLLLPVTACEVINKIESAGFEAWAVGGCVRDMLLSRQISDVDIASNAAPEDIHRIFERVIDTGIKHGTVTVLYGGESFEITRYRADGDYFDSRHPQSVTSVSDITEDLSRRDFTVNAMAYHPERGLIDLFEGEKDTENKIIRCVGDPDKRFAEDALRIMRCFRFASKLEFDIEENTLKSAKKLAGTLENISAERIYKELIYTLRGDDPDKLILLLESGGLDFLGLPMIPMDLSGLTKLEKSEETLMAAFLLLSGCDDSTDACKILKTSKKVRDDVKTILYDFNFGLCKTDSDIKARLDAYGENLLKILQIRKFCLFEDTEYAMRRIGQITKNNEPYKISHLAVTGNDLKTVGVNGSETGRVLEALIKIVRNDASKNNKEYLISLAKEYVIH